MGVAFVDRLTPLVVRGDTEGAWQLLRSLQGDELREAKNWFARERPWLTTIYSLDIAGETYEDKSDNRDEALWIEAMCAAALCGSVTAARRVPWGSLSEWRTSAGEVLFVRMLRDAEPRWVAEFVTTASQVSMGSDASNRGQVLSRLLRAAVVHHGLPCPTGRTFLKHWRAGTEGTSSDDLARDPLMPELLFHYLASGHCGDARWLPDAVADLVRAGVVNRAELVAHVLALFTAPQRPASQMVLARIASAMDLRAEEIPGGLTYVLGVLATSHGSVGRVLVPRAVALVADRDGLLQLTTLVHGRREKKQKEMLLAGLRKPSLLASVGRAPVKEALSLLSAGDDFAFSARVRRAAQTLGVDIASQSAGVATGLWHLAPTSSGAEHRRSLWEREPFWSQLLDARHEVAQNASPWLVDLALAAMAQGQFDDGATIRDSALWRLEQGRLAVSRLAGALSDIFLGGGMRLAWPSALAIADAACGAPRRPPGLHDLLRMLASYAADAPQQDLPSHIAAMAAAQGRSKASMEARKLGATLSGMTIGEFVQRPRAAPPSAVEPPRVRGLWTAERPEELLPSYVRLDPLPSHLHALRAALEADFNYYAQSYGDVCFWPPGYGELSEATNLTNPDNVLAATVKAIHDCGAEAVRAALTGIIWKYRPLDVVAAIDLWIANRLDVPTFWRLAHRSATNREVRHAWWNDPTMTPEERQERLGALPSLAEAVTSDETEVLVLPPALNTATARVAFIRACELLLLAGETPVVLSTPTWADGTIDFDDLLARLRAVYGRPVGPLDLVQALHRLRPTQPSRVAELDLGPLQTLAILTDPAGAVTWDAVELVRTWVECGGLPPLEPFAEGDRWSTTAKAPVPWSACAAAPAELREDPWCPGSIPETVRMMPLWGDRTIPDAFPARSMYDPRDFPGRIAGPFGLPLHDRLLALMALAEKRAIPRAMETVFDVARHDRLDPHMAAAAAVGRHHAGTLALGRLTESFAMAFEGGGLRGTWPSALAIAAALSSVPRKPSRLPELMRLLTAYAHEVPEPSVPDQLRVFAAQRGTSRSHVEARSLMAALERI